MKKYKVVVELDDGVTRIGAESLAAEIVREFPDDITRAAVTEDQEADDGNHNPEQGGTLVVRVIRVLGTNGGYKK